MAKGRMIVKEICYDSRIWGMSDLAKMLFPYCLPHIEADGTLPRNARILRLMCFPAAKIADAEMEGVILEWIAARTDGGPALCAENAGRLFFSDFFDSQAGLCSGKRVKKWRERCKSVTGVTDVTVTAGKTREVKGSEGKGREVKEYLKTYAPSPTDSTPADVASKPVMVFPCAGTPREWTLTEAKVAEYSLSFPGVEVHRECLKARQWVLDNPRNRKTAAGMPRFLSGWLGRTQNRGVATGGKNGTSGVNSDLIARG